jgi:hypothetical protein
MDIELVEGLVYSSPNHAIACEEVTEYKEYGFVEVDFGQAKDSEEKYR